MSVDKLVDSTLLDAACTYEAGKIREKLGSSALLTYDLANGKGFGDAIAAIPTGGGSGITKEEGTFTGNGGYTISFTVAKQQSPDIVIVMRDDYQSMTAVSDRANACTVGVRPGLVASTYTASASTSLANAGAKAQSSANWYDSTSVANNEITFKTSTNTLYIRTGNNSNLWSSSLTYKYTLIFLS